MRLAHESVPKTTRAIEKGVLFRWNRADLSQFILADPMNQGWRIAYVAEADGIPAHVSLHAPPQWEGSVGPVFLLVREDLRESDHRLEVTHDLLDPSSYYQEAGNVDRYGGALDHVVTTWAVGLSRAPKMCSLVVENGLPNTVTVVTEPAPRVARTTSSVWGRLYGCGAGRISGYEESRAGPGYLLSDKTVGFAVLCLASLSPSGGEEFRIFDLVAAPIGGPDA